VYCAPRHHRRDACTSRAHTSPAILRWYRSAEFRKPLAALLCLRSSAVARGGAYRRKQAQYGQDDDDRKDISKDVMVPLGSRGHLRRLLNLDPTRQSIRWGRGKMANNERHRPGAARGSKFSVKSVFNGAKPSRPGELWRLSQASPSPPWLSRMCPFRCVLFTSATRRDTNRRLVHYIPITWARTRASSASAARPRCTRLKLMAAS
jgi:hypothetical protein